MFKKTVKPPKKTLKDLMTDKTIIKGSDVIKRNEELKIIRKQFEESIEFEQRNRRVKK